MDRPVMQLPAERYEPPDGRAGVIAENLGGPLAATSLLNDYRKAGANPAQFLQAVDTRLGTQQGKRRAELVEDGTPLDSNDQLKKNKQRVEGEFSFGDTTGAAIDKDKLPVWLPFDEDTLTWVNTIVKEYEAGSATMSVQGCPVGVAPHLRRFFVRGKTRAIIRRVLEGWQGDSTGNHVIGGDSGLGKSLSSIFLFAAILSTHPTACILWRLGTSGTYTVLSRKRCGFTMNEEILISFLEPNAERYYIVDGEKPKHINVKTVLITSPCLEISKRYVECLRPSIHMTPEWSKSDLLAAAAECFGLSADWVGRIERMLLIWGGVPGYILNGKHLEHDLSPMDQALQTVTTDTLNLVAKRAVPLEMPHSLWRTVVDEDFQPVGLAFASPKAEELVVAQFLAQHFLDIEDLLAAAQDPSAIATGVATRLCEEFCHHSMLTAKKLHLISLHSKDKFIDIEAPKKKVPFSSLGELKPEVRVLSIPLAKNFPSVVSLMDPDVLFRITLADWHDINGDGLIDAALKLSSHHAGVKFVFVLPEARAKTFTVGKLTPAEGRQEQLASLEERLEELDKVVREAKEAGVPCDLAAPNTAHTIFYGDAFEVEEAAVSDYSTGSN